MMETVRWWRRWDDGDGEMMETARWTPYGQDSDDDGVDDYAGDGDDNKDDGDDEMMVIRWPSQA